MNCPSESHKIEDTEKREKYQTGRQPGLKDYVAGAGIKILKAVRLYSSNEKVDKDKIKMKLETLLGQNVTVNGFDDSAWGGKCGCQNVSRSEVKHETYTGDICTCDKVKCNCDDVCRCESDCGYDSNESY